jgi:predicted nucleic acid-binding Zn ribbon protein
VSEPVRVGEILGSLPGLAERLAGARLLQAWPAIAGPAAPRTRADRIENGCLHVTVESSAWLHRLTLEEAALLERCRDVSPIRAIRFHLGSLPPPGAVDRRGGAAP